MGIFGFGQSKSYSLAEAMKLINLELASVENSRTEEVKELSSHLRRDFSEFRKVIDEFSKCRAPEHAKGSAKVRDRFCEIAARQISDLLAGNDKYLPDESRKLLLNLGGLTERQLLHLSFFFKDDIVPVARKMKEINGMLEKSRRSAPEHARAAHLFERISLLERDIEASRKSISENDEEIKSIESRKSAVSFTPDHVDSSALLLVEKKLNIIRQEIDSLLSVQKALRKYTHAQGINNELLDSYMNSPSSAILNDSGLLIFDFLRAAAVFDDSGKVMHALNRQDYLKGKRVELMEAAKLYDEERRKYEQLSAAAASKAMEAKRKTAALEMEERDLGKSIADSKAAIDAATREISQTRAELCLLASKILKANVA